MDGNHKKVPTLHYFNLFLEKINTNSIVVIDDIHWSTEMEEAWESLINSEKVRLSIDLFRMGILFFRKELSKQHFIIKY